jgi:hypothetical protein
MDAEIRNTVFEHDGIPIFCKIFLDADSEKTIIGVSQMLYDLSWVPAGYDKIKEHTQVFGSCFSPFFYFCFFLFRFLTTDLSNPFRKID